MLLLSSCEIIDLSRGEPYKNPKEQAENILLFLEEGNVEGIREMFCERLKKQKGIEEKIQNTINIFEGTIISYDSKGREGRAIWGSDGNKIQETGACQNIITDTGQVYDLIVGFYKVNDFESDLVGVNNLILYKKDEENEEWIELIRIEV